MSESTRIILDKKQSLGAFQDWVESDDCPEELNKQLSQAFHAGFEYGTGAQQRPCPTCQRIGACLTDDPQADAFIDHTGGSANA